MTDPERSGSLEVRVVDHPLVAVHLTALRDERTPPARFRDLLLDLGTLLAYEATRGLALTPLPVRTPVAPTVGAALVASPLLVPVLRAGLGLLPAFTRLLPGSPVGMAGLRRDERTLQPTWYLDGLPAELARRPVLVLDPMLATGGTLLAVLGELARRDPGPVTVVSVLAAPEGIEAVAAACRSAAPGSAPTLVVAAVDEGLDGSGWIVPGLGDAGDRQTDAATGT